MTGLHEAAYVCGGPERVALVALVELERAGRVRISSGGHRVSVLAREADDPITAAALAAVPDTGRVLRAVLRDVASATAVAGLAAALRAEGVVAHRLLPTRLTSRGRRLRRSLTSDVTTERRTAVLGVPGIADPRVRRIFETPDPPPAASLLPKNRRWPDHAGPYDAPDRSGDSGGLP
ncbi:TIGR04222 domain-containing membrane protein [Actinomadura atramentaria]|uniref:TIGR04222 domain-containing membrane protein n=1 Tax=Actinomadura atramentaria TaxID=1990 RepID=UPI00036D016C|nr:TIGR04222 domain-containing membrane protein [Actinomadura atramentaria]